MSLPFWRAAPLPGPPPPLPRRIEVAVAGGGIAGVSLLRALQRAGADAVLLERDHLAAGASGRNAGYLLAGVAENYATAVRRHGRDVAGEVWSFTARNHELLHDAVAAVPEVGYLRRGSWTLATTDGEAADLQESAELLAEDGVHVEWHPRPSTQLPGVHGGLLNPGDGELHPANAVRALAAPMLSEVHERTAVQALEPSTHGVRLHTARGELHADRVVLALNAWIPTLLPDAPVFPVRGQLLATAPYAQTVVDRPVYAQHGYQYWRQLRSGEVLVGGWRDTAIAEEVGYSQEPTDAVQRHLDGHLRLLGVDAPVTHRWAGAMGFTPDELPLAGESGHAGVLVCGGFTGHGMGFAMHTAERLVDHLLQGTPLPGWLDATRLQRAVLR